MISAQDRQEAVRLIEEAGKAGAELAAQLVRRTVLARGRTDQPLVLHADNASPQKGATLLATLESLGNRASDTRSCFMHQPAVGRFGWP